MLRLGALPALGLLVPGVVEAQAARVPALPPDSIPAWVYDDSSSVVMEGPCGRELKQVLVVWFRDNTSQSQRQQALDQVQGTVIGGIAVFDGDGYYYVRIPGQGTAAERARAALALRAMPQVEMAELVHLLCPTTH
jgi:hypothetical protein